MNDSPVKQHGFVQKMSTFGPVPTKKVNRKSASALKRASSHLSSISSIENSLASSDDTDGTSYVVAGQGISYRALQENFLHQVSLKCTEECHMATLYKTDFDCIFKRLADRAREDAIAFLWEMPYF